MADGEAAVTSAGGIGMDDRAANCARRSALFSVPFSMALRISRSISRWNWPLSHAAGALP